MGRRGAGRIGRAGHDAGHGHAQQEAEGLGAARAEESSEAVQPGKAQCRLGGEVYKGRERANLPWADSFRAAPQRCDMWVLEPAIWTAVAALLPEPGYHRGWCMPVPSCSPYIRRHSRPCFFFFFSAGACCAGSPCFCCAALVAYTPPPPAGGVPGGRGADAVLAGRPAPAAS